MDRRLAQWVRLAAVGCLVACGSDPAPAASGPGTAGGSAAGGAAPSGAGSAGAPSLPTGGSGQASGGTGQPLGGSAGSLGVAGAAGAGGGSSGGAGGGPAVLALPKRVLLYHFSGYKIPSVPAQLTFLTTTLQGWGYEVEVSEAPSAFTTQNLARFGAVAMVNNCFEPFGLGSDGAAETAALSAFVDNGGGLFGTHCATVTFQSAEPPAAYNGLIGGRGGDGFFEGQSACRTTEEAHPTTALLAATFDYTGNIDNADFLAPDTKVLVKCKWSSGDQKDTAVSWYRTPAKGRVFYTNFAKEDVDLKDATLGAKHILLGLGWVLGR